MADCLSAYEGDRRHWIPVKIVFQSRRSEELPELRLMTGSNYPLSRAISTHIFVFLVGLDTWEWVKTIRAKIFADVRRPY